MAQITNGGGLFEEAYSHEALEKILFQYFGIKGWVTAVPVMVTSYDIERRKTVFLKSWHQNIASCCVRSVARNLGGADLL